MRTSIACCTAHHTHHTNSLSRSRGAFLRPAFAFLLQSPRTEGWAERRETFGCSGTRWACHLASKTRVNALSPQHALAGPIPVFSCFSADLGSSIPGLTISSTHTHFLVPAAHFCARGFAPLLHSPRIEGWAERRETFGCSGTRWACHLASKTRVNALMTRHARRLASHGAGRSPLGAPPWRFWAPGAALPSPALPPDPYSELLAARS